MPDDESRQTMEKLMSGESNMASNGEFQDLRNEVETLKRDLAVQQATQAGAEATQSAAQAGQMATVTASQAGMSAAMISGFVALVVGLFLGMTVVNVRK
jgi:hypothetical protein